MFFNKKLSRKIFSYSIKHEFTLNILYSIVTGLIVGLAAVLFHNSIEFFNELFFKQTANGLYFLGTYAVIFIPAVGMLIQSIMILLAPDYANKRGVTEVIKAVALSNKIPFRTTIFHFIAPVISIGSGNTVGPEGPAARLGGGIANKLAFLFKLPDNKKRVLTAAGAGAAISAIFNTPIGGIFFALEIILLNEFSTSSFPTLILSSITASAVSRSFLGNKSVFIFHSPEVGNYLQLYHYALLGIFAGIVSFAFVTYSDLLNKFFQIKFIKKIPQWVLMTSIGLIVGISGYFYKYILGIGYNGINQILSNSLAWQVVFILLILKFMLVPMVLNSGGFGGIFAPSLFIGACLGYLYGISTHTLFGNNIDITAFVLVGMGAVLGGINFIPISAILIIFEMTKDYSFILPLMLAVVTSTMFVQLTLKKSIHERYLEQQGYRIAQRKEINIDFIPVKYAMKKDIDVIHENTPLTVLIKKLVESNHNVFYIVNNSGKINGYISLSNLRELFTSYESIKDILVAKDIASNNITIIKEDDTLETVIRLFEITEIDEFPVVSSDGEKILGTISRNDVISLYNKESLKTELIEQLSFNLIKLEKAKRVKIFEGYSIIEKNVPKDLVGKSLLQLEFRKNFDLEVLMIKKSSTDKENVIFPNSNYVIEKGDSFILFGKDENIDKVENW